MLSLFLALGSNISFAVASLFFTDYSRQISSTWMNYFKVCVAFLCFSIVCFIFQIPFNLSSSSFYLLVVSGAIGLLIGDIFLFRAFMHLGSGRVLMIFGFQPLLLGLSSYYFFQEDFSFHRLMAILFLVACLFCFSLESFKEKGHWDISGLIYALLGVFLDGIGVLLTKQAFRLSPDVSVLSANFIRAGAAFLGFFCLSLIPYFSLSLVKPYMALPKKDKYLVVMASGLGTFLSLVFYLKAIQIGHIATISAISGTSPLFATLFEILNGRKKVTPYLIGAFLSFFIGLSILLFI
jgi:drug/metabolite transporter (DMT)-like permease